MWVRAGAGIRLVTGMAALLVMGVLGGCSSAQTESEAPPVVLPGAPGDEPEVTTGTQLGQRSQPGPQSQHADLAAEVDYVGMMIPHHQQAVEMTDLAADRAEHPKVRALAARIGGAQGPEIGAMEGWLAVHGPADEHASGHGQAHGHAGMPGMATPEQMAELGAARGAEFDRLFLRLMTAHHEGAVWMATDYLTRGTDEQVHEMAQDVLATQTDEIGTMRVLSAELA